MEKHPVGGFVHSNRERLSECSFYRKEERGTSVRPKPAQRSPLLHRLVHRGKGRRGSEQENGRMGLGEKRLGEGKEGTHEK